MARGINAQRWRDQPWAVAPPNSSARDGSQLASARLDRERTVWARAQALSLRAGLAALQGRQAQAAVQLRAAAQAYRDADMALCAAVAEYRLGTLGGGTEGRALRQGAEAWMTAQAIRRPERVAALFAPGFAGS